MRLRLNSKGREYGLTAEYLFLLLSIEEIGLYPAIRRAVIASTIPHLREERFREIELPILDVDSITEITKLLKEAFELKNRKKILIREITVKINKYFAA